MTEPKRRGVLQNCLWLGGRFLVFPFRLIRYVRRSMTPASVTLLLITIVTLNIVWGYPWLGMFAACMTLLMGGFVVNQLFGPRLRVELNPPISAPAGSSFLVSANLSNVGRLPLYDAEVSFEHRRSASIRTHDRQCLDGVQPGQTAARTFRFAASRRGEHSFPDVISESTFPFSLFRCRRRLLSGQTMMVTPKLLDAGQDQLQAQLAAAIGAWTRRQVTGESSEYTGNREYQSGMTVRRWDHASWARLGRPIVREYSAVSVSQVTLIVDTSDAVADSASSARETNDAQLERLLSAASTAVTGLSGQGMEIRMLLTNEGDLDASQSSPCRPSKELQPLLLRLAVATRVRRHESERLIEQALEKYSGSILLLTTQPSTSWEHLPKSSVHVIHVQTGPETARIDGAHEVTPRFLPPVLETEPASVP